MLLDTVFFTLFWHCSRCQNWLWHATRYTYRM